MRRAPIVLAGTAAGIAGVLAYHTTGSTKLVVVGAGSAPATAQAGGRATTTTTHTTTRATAARTRSTAAATTTTTSRPVHRAASARTAVGEAVSYGYGNLQVRVTKRGSRITHVAITHLLVPDQQSAVIDQSAVPTLQSQALAAQSANIDGVSGASFTSAAYRRSLQSALDRLA